jgi:hypothetical protein
MCSFDLDFSRKGLEDEIYYDMELRRQGEMRPLCSASLGLVTPHIVTHGTLESHPNPMC